MAVGSLLQNEKVLFTSTESLATEVKAAKTMDDFVHIETRLKDLYFKIALQGDDASEQLQLLLSLFKLLLENVSSLLDEDNWLRGQVIVIQELITGEIVELLLPNASCSFVLRRIKIPFSTCYFILPR
jgi:diguanylate cyclase